MKCASRDIQQQQGGSQIEVIPELTPEHKKALMSIFCQRINNPLTCNAHDRDSQWVQIISEILFQCSFIFRRHLRHRPTKDLRKNKYAPLERILTICVHLTRVAAGILTKKRVARGTNRPFASKVKQCSLTRDPSQLIKIKEDTT